MSVHTKPHRKHAKLLNKFAKFAAFNNMIDEGGEFAKTGRQAKKATTQHWEKRDMRAGSYYNKAHAKAGVVTITNTY